ncbi:unnamed protein product [Pseudo-nitzschia multistriata]|uniref:PNPLA domain-containing protein n=1 Tax=Pseudo-nitzschia multistriata TaxID=183589 RepID=A0A448YXK1_9STRA|nr:unnamed protein product [Pseudo-nitzschia multistriata]
MFVIGNNKRDTSSDRHLRRDRIVNAKRNAPVSTSRWEERTQHFKDVFLFFALCMISTSFLSEQCAVEAFQIDSVGAGPRQRHKAQEQFRTISASTTTTKSQSCSESAAKMQLSVVPLKVAEDNYSGDSIETETMTVAGNSTSQFLMNFNASGSIGSLLMQMQKKEAELRQLNQSASLLLSEDQALKLDPNDGSSTNQEPTALKNNLFSWIRKTNGSAKNGFADVDAPTASEGVNGSTAEAISSMNDEMARELDDSVSIRITNSVKDITLLGPPDIYQRSRSEEGNQDDDTPFRTVLVEEETQTETNAKNENAVTEDKLPPLSRPEHYDRRIGRDMRHLSVSIASCIDSVEEWQLFCQQTPGGLAPLVECIREGAESIREGSPSLASLSLEHQYLASSPYSSGSTTKEENFQAASSACKAIRDLCALSLDLASVITDGLLRANAAYKEQGEPSLMDDLCTILRYDDELSDLLVAPRRRRRRRLLSFRRRKGKQAGQETPQPDPSENDPLSSPTSKPSKWPIGIFRRRREARLRWKLYVTQLLLAMTCASDSAVDAIRCTEGLQDVLLVHSSYARKERRRRWMRYPGELIKSMWLKKRKLRNNKEASPATPEQRRQPFIEAASLKANLRGRITGTANQVLAAIGYNEWVPKIPGQKGLRILCLDGGGSRGMTSVVAMKCLVDSLGGMEVADCFDLVVGTSTGAIIAFLVGLNRETSEQAVERYDVLIEKIFTKSAFSTPMLLFTTASYDESPFMNVLTDILKDRTMLDSRANPAVPLVFAVTSKMSSNPTHVALFRNYNYSGGELPDPFMINPDEARENLDLPLGNEAKIIRMSNYRKKEEHVQPVDETPVPDNGSRHPGSFRLLQKYALRASTAAPTVFKPVLMGGEMYCDGGIVASNPSAIAIHEARTVFPGVPIELVVSIGTGGFKEQKSEPKIGWDGIIGQIINSATDGEQIHHILEDVLGDGTTAQGKSSVSDTCYMRFNPVLGMPDEFPIGELFELSSFAAIPISCHHTNMPFLYFFCILATGQLPKR